MKRSTHLLSMLHFLPSGAFLRLAYMNETGHILNLKNPRRFNEKLNWLKLYGGAEEWGQYVDKLEVRGHVQRAIGNEHLVHLIAQYDSVDEIDWAALPERFVIKCSHGSHCGLICTDKASFDTAGAENKLRKWMRRNWYWVGREKPYRTLKPRIMVEQFIGDDHPAQDYKLMCFDGVPRIIQVHTNETEPPASTFSTCPARSWRCTRRDSRTVRWNISNRAVIHSLYPVAQTLAAGFPYVRIDLYLHGGQCVFREMTFFDSAALREFEPDPVNFQLGDMIVLPDPVPCGVFGQRKKLQGGGPSRPSAFWTCSTILSKRITCLTLGIGRRCGVNSPTCWTRFPRRHTLRVNGAMR